VQQVNVTNVTNVTNITNVTTVTNVTNVQYRNREVPGAMMATSNSAFVSARPVQRAAVPVGPELRNAAVLGSAPAVAPTRASLVTVAGPAHAPPAGIVNRPVVAKVAPPIAPVPFVVKQQALAANGGRPLSPAQEAQIRQTTPALARPDMTPVRPALVAPGGAGLQPAHAGLPAATPVASAHGDQDGFAARPSITTRPVTTPPAVANAGGSAVASRVPQQSDRPRNGHGANGSANNVGGSASNVQQAAVVHPPVTPGGQPVPQPRKGPTAQSGASVAAAPTGEGKVSKARPVSPNAGHPGSVQARKVESGSKAPAEHEHPTPKEPKEQKDPKGRER
jgi:hypothetical protein